MPPRANQFLTRLGLLAGLVIAPKCVLCLLAWVGLLLGLAGPELCGPP